MMLEQDRRWLPAARRALFETYRRQAAGVWIEACGTSMRPLILPGDWMLVEFGAAQAGLGEIVLFAQGEALVAHRLVARRAGAPSLVVKGDNELFADPPLHASDVLGVVRALRCGPDGSPRRGGCSGRAAYAAALASYWGGRAASLARRLPVPLRRVALRAISPLARVAVWSALLWARRAV